MSEATSETRVAREIRLISESLGEFGTVWESWKFGNKTFKKQKKNRGHRSNSVTMVQAKSCGTML